ncbi:CBS domain-containing protein, partial [Acinetobacter baumannii]
DHDAPLADILAVIRRHKYSRYPVWDSHQGEFIGLLHIKDLLLALSALDSLPETFDLDELVRPLEIVTKHTPLSRLLEQFRKGGAHFAVVEE